MYKRRSEYTPDLAGCDAVPPSTYLHISDGNEVREGQVSDDFVSLAHVCQNRDANTDDD
jgi:hypothetical protein